MKKRICHHLAEGGAGMTEEEMTLRLAEHMLEHNEHHREEILHLAEHFRAEEKYEAAEHAARAARLMGLADRALAEAMAAGKEP